jgi:hypothetical protein
VREQDSTGHAVVRHTVDVLTVAELPEDVDYRTGNVDVPGNVVVGGTVRSGFSVRAAGAVVIKGSVEAGASVTANGDITVGQGIVGEATRVHSREGTVTAKFVHEAQLEAGLDVGLGSYAHNARIRAGHRLLVEGRGGSGGGIVGGRCWAGQEVAALNLGSERSTNTHVYAGVDPQQHARYTDLARTATQAQLMLDRLLDAIELPALDPLEIRKLIARLPARKLVVLRFVKKASELARVRDQARREQQELAAQIAALADQAQVAVREVAHRRVVVHIGSQETVLDQTYRGVTFRLDAGTGQVAVVQS